MKSTLLAISTILLLGSLIAFYPQSEPKTILAEYREYMTRFNKK